MEKYGEVFYFKVGLYVGFVILGEIGVIKKDIVYFGDVLNIIVCIINFCY